MQCISFTDIIYYCLSGPFSKKYASVNYSYTNDEK